MRKLLEVLHAGVKPLWRWLLSINLEVIKTADWVLDLRLNGATRGGEIVTEGAPEQVAAEPRSCTGAEPLTFSLAIYSAHTIEEKNAVLPPSATTTGRREIS